MANYRLQQTIFKCDGICLWCNMFAELLIKKSFSQLLNYFLHGVPYIPFHSRTNMDAMRDEKSMTSREGNVKLNVKLSC